MITTTLNRLNSLSSKKLTRSKIGETSDENITKKLPSCKKYPKHTKNMPNSYARNSPITQLFDPIAMQKLA